MGYAPVMKIKAMVSVGLAFVLSFSVLAQNAPEPAEATLALVLRDSDTGFGGFYLDIEKTMETLGVTRLEATEIQNQMRDELETLAGGVSMVAQRPYLPVALSNSIDSVVRRKQHEGGFKPIKFESGEFVVVLDLDETLLTHWYELGKGDGATRMGTLFPPERDTVPVYVDNAGNSLEQPMLKISPAAVQVRPGVDTFFRKVSLIPGFKGFIMFTAKEDRAAQSLRRVWELAQPELFRKVIGFYGRNHLTFKAGLTKASKDLRIFDETLKHVVLIDDNESRVLQKELCYQIPKFNADGYLKSVYLERDKRISSINELLFPYLATRMAECGRAGTDTKEDIEFTSCFRDKLGRLSEQPKGELHDYERELLEIGFDLKDLDLEKTFEQVFHFDIERPLDGSFQRYSAGRLSAEGLFE